MNKYFEKLLDLEHQYREGLISTVEYLIEIKSLTEQALATEVYKLQVQREQINENLKLAGYDS